MPLCHKCELDWKDCHCADKYREEIMSKKKLNIRVGQYWKTRDGKIVKITRVDNRNPDIGYPIEVNNDRLVTSDGKCWRDKKNDKDLVEQVYISTKPNQNKEVKKFLNRFKNKTKGGSEFEIAGIIGDRAYGRLADDTARSWDIYSGEAKFGGKDSLVPGRSMNFTEAMECVLNGGKVRRIGKDFESEVIHTKPINNATGVVCVNGGRLQVSKHWMGAKYEKID